MNPIPPKNDPARLLWTGGWDSTFQLLRLLLIDRREVRPYYLIDAERKSTGAELLAMQRIRTRIIQGFPTAQSLLQATHFTAVHELPSEPEITAAFRTVRQQQYVGTQYEWLARFCRQHRMSELQLCIHQDDKAHAILEGLVTEGTEEKTPILHVDPAYQGTDEYRLFHFFVFPLFAFSKIQMAEFADRQGWREIMDLTWFCHTPTRKLTPCGRCKACLYTIEEGLARRIPLRRRITYYLRRRLFPLINPRTS